MSTPTLTEFRARGIELPADDPTAQGIIDEQVDWLRHQIGQLFDERTETFYVGTWHTRGILYLRRYTVIDDDFVVTDNAVEVDPTTYRLVEDGSAVQRTYVAVSRIWNGPYVTVTYTPDDIASVRRVLFDLVAMAAIGSTGEGAGGFESEVIGSYSYKLADGATAGAMTGTRGALASGILPKRQPIVTLETAPR